MKEDGSMPLDGRGATGYKAYIRKAIHNSNRTSIMGHFLSWDIFFYVLFWRSPRFPWASFPAHTKKRGRGRKEEEDTRRGSLKN